MADPNMTTNLTIDADRPTYVREINAAWQMGVQSVLETGRLLIEAKKRLPHGEYEAMIERDLPFGARTARRLVNVAESPVLSNRTHASDLPASWMTLYELTKVPETKLIAKIGTANVRSDEAVLDVRSRAGVPF